jgi:hypothetical protein
VVGPDLDVLQAAAGIRGGAKREVQGVDAHRRLHLAVMGLRGHALGADEGGNTHADGFPACSGALEDVDLR